MMKIAPAHPTSDVYLKPKLLYPTRLKNQKVNAEAFTFPSITILLYPPIVRGISRPSNLRLLENAFFISSEPTDNIRGGNSDHLEALKH